MVPSEENQLVPKEVKRNGLGAVDYYARLPIGRWRWPLRREGGLGSGDRPKVEVGGGLARPGSAWLRCLPARRGWREGLSLCGGQAALAFRGGLAGGE